MKSIGVSMRIKARLVSGRPVPLESADMKKVGLFTRWEGDSEVWDNVLTPDDGV